MCNKPLLSITTSPLRETRCRRVMLFNRVLWTKISNSGYVIVCNSSHFVHLDLFAVLLFYVLRGNVLDLRSYWNLGGKGKDK